MELGGVEGKESKKETGELTTPFKRQLLDQFI